jgi:hypothetical protein
MSREIKHIGMNVHKEAIVIAVLDGSGKLVMETILETKASSILRLIHGLRGDHTSLPSHTEPMVRITVTRSSSVRAISRCNTPVLKVARYGDVKQPRLNARPRPHRLSRAIAQ